MTTELETYTFQANIRSILIYQDGGNITKICNEEVWDKNPHHYKLKCSKNDNQLELLKDIFRREDYIFDDDYFNSNVRITNENDKIIVNSKNHPYFLRLNIDLKNRIISKKLICEYDTTIGQIKRILESKVNVELPEGGYFIHNNILLNDDISVNKLFFHTSKDLNELKYVRPMENTDFC